MINKICKYIKQKKIKSEMENRKFIKIIEKRFDGYKVYSIKKSSKYVELKATYLDKHIKSKWSRDIFEYWEG